MNIGAFPLWEASPGEVGDIDSDYAGVAEQSGIKAGDGGFDVKVGKDAQLQGHVVSKDRRISIWDPYKY